jgi:putative membrane protein insertion efficiency factor
MKNIIIYFLEFYKHYISKPLSVVFGNACRFTPTCSEYTIEALRKYGVLKGLSMGAKRISRCHPWGGYGFDPVE